MIVEAIVTQTTIIHRICINVCSKIYKSLYISINFYIFLLKIRHFVGTSMLVVRKVLSRNPRSISLLCFLICKGNGISGFRRMVKSRSNIYINSLRVCRWAWDTFSFDLFYTSDGRTLMFTSLSVCPCRIGADMKWNRKFLHLIHVDLRYNRK